MEAEIARRWDAREQGPGRRRERSKDVLRVRIIRPRRDTSVAGGIERLEARHGHHDRDLFPVGERNSVVLSNYCLLTNNKWVV